MSIYRKEVLNKAFEWCKPADANIADFDTWIAGAFPNAEQMPIFEFHVRVMALTPDRFQCKLRWDLSVDAIKSLSEEIMASTKATLDAVAAVPEGAHSWCTVMKPLVDDETLTMTLGSVVDFPQHVSASKELRDACCEADTKMSAFNVECNMRVDVYQSVMKYHARYEQVKAADAGWPADLQEHSAEEERLVQRMLRDFRRSGLHLEQLFMISSQPQRARLQSLKTRMSELSIQFSKNLGEEDSKFEVTREELAGMPDDFINNRPKTEDGAKIILDLKYPCILPLMKMCKVRRTREMMERGFNSRCIDKNVAILEELIKLRSEEASILGYPTSSAFVLEIRMAKKPDTVVQFLEELSTLLDPFAAKEMAELLALKQAECSSGDEQHKQLVGECDGKINQFDFQYYLNQRMEKFFQVDHEKIKEYFPLEIVTAGLLDIYQRLLGLTFTLVPNAHVWHEDVLLYAVHDTASGQLVGHFYLDMFPRQGKYGHAACFGLQAGCRDPSKTWQTPVAACVCNFSKATADRPSLLRHEEVETFFHEFGHVMHQLCTKARFARFSGTHVERDFVEAPSQMLENWVWQPESLKMMSGHYQDHSQKLPEDLLTKLIAAKDANIALLTKRQITFGIFDQLVHSRDIEKHGLDTAAIYTEVQSRILGVTPTQGTNFAAGFGHIAGGYQSSYYGYLWSEVFCEDMFASKFGKDHLLDPAVGMQYREKILARGGSVDAEHMLEDFLGRAPSKEAFLRSKGL